MSYSRKTRAQHVRSLKHTEVRTGLGHLFYLLRWLGLKRVAHFLIRQKWHIADVYCNGRYVMPLYVVNKRRMLKRMQKAAAKRR